MRGALGRRLETWRTYAGAPPVVQAFAAARLAIAPLGELDRQLEGRSGHVLSIGSGLAMVERYLATGHADLVFECTDLDAEKVELLRRTGHRSPTVTIEQADALQLDRPGRYDVVLACDVLHHLPADRQDEALDRLYEALAPGGIVLVKDLDVEPRWKHRWNEVHDRLVAGPEPITCRPPGDVAAVLVRSGAAVESAERIEGPLNPYAHWIVRAAKPGS